jgi:hypothetical protein
LQALRDDGNVVLNAAAVARIIADEDRAARAVEVLEAAAATYRPAAAG